jgi:hypothetical protein
MGALLGLVIVLASTVAAQAPASAIVAPDYSLVARTSVVTADGLTWQLSLTYQQDASMLQITLQRHVSSPSGVESQYWQVPVPAADFATDGAGQAQLDLGHDGGSLLRVDLTFIPASRAPASCGVGSGTTYTGTLSGMFLLTTGLRAGGTVGGNTLHFTSGTPQLTANVGCGPVEHTITPCFRGAEAGVTPDSPDAPEADARTSFSGTSAEVLFVSSEVKLTSPAGAVRSGGVELSAAPVPRYSASTRTLTLSLGSSGLITGGGTWSHGSQHSITAACYSGSKTYTLRAIVDSDATYRADSKHPLTAHTALTGQLHLPAEVKDCLYAVITAVSGPRSATVRAR